MSARTADRGKVLDILNIAAGNFGAVDKEVGVLLHDAGFMRYAKLTPENYEYWWYEVENPDGGQKKKAFTYDWADMAMTHNFGFLLSLAKRHGKKANLHKVINNALCLLSAAQDGKNADTGRRCYQEAWEVYYGRDNPMLVPWHRKGEAVQMELFQWLLRQGMKVRQRSVRE